MTLTAGTDKLSSAMSTRSGLLIKNIPEAVRKAVAEDAEARHTNRNNVICEIIASRLRVPWEPTSYRYKASASESMFLRMPRELHAALRERAQSMSDPPERRIAMGRLVISMLQDHYGLPVESPRRRPTTPPLDEAVVQEARARHEAGESIRSLAIRYDIQRVRLTRAIKAAA